MIRTWSDRRRSWLMFGTAISCVIIFLAIWATYAAIHVYPRYRQLPAGTTATVDGKTFRLLGLHRTDVITDGDETQPASAHATWVIADLAVTVDGKPDVMGCSLPLVGEAKRTWEAETFYSRKLPGYCDSDEVKAGVPYRFEQIYQVPSALADNIYGVGVEDHTSPDPVQVLTP